MAGRRYIPDGGQFHLLRDAERRLRVAPEHRVAEDSVIASLERSFSAPDSRCQLDAAIDRGQYAELFAYDDDAGVFFIEVNAPADAE